MSPRVPLDGRMISDGWFRVANETYDNLIPVPLARVGTVVAHLTLVDAAAVDITGVALSVELSGVARDIETLPSEWAPEGEDRTRAIHATRKKRARVMASVMRRDAT